MAHNLIAVKSLWRTYTEAEGPPVAAKGCAYSVWTIPDGYGKWKFCFSLLGTNEFVFDECNLETAEQIFGIENIEKHFSLAYSNDHVFFARSRHTDEEDIL